MQWMNGAFQEAPVVKNPPINAGVERDLSSIPRSGRSPAVGNSNPLQYSCWTIPQTEEPVGLQSMGHKELDMTE